MNWSRNTLRSSIVLSDNPSFSITSSAVISPALICSINLRTSLFISVNPRVLASLASASSVCTARSFFSISAAFSAALIRSCVDRVWSSAAFFSFSISARLAARDMDSMTSLLSISFKTSASFHACLVSLTISSPIPANMDLASFPACLKFPVNRFTKALPNLPARSIKTFTVAPRAPIILLAASTPFCVLVNHDTREASTTKRAPIPSPSMAVPSSLTTLVSPVVVFATVINF